MGGRIPATRYMLFTVAVRMVLNDLRTLEIMSYGRPVVCTDVNGLPDTVKDGGVYVKPKDAKGLADAINSLLTDEGKRRELGSNARKVAEDQNVSSTVDIVESVYRSVVQ